MQLFESPATIPEFVALEVIEFPPIIVAEVLEPPAPINDPKPATVFLIPPATTDQSPLAAFLLPEVPASPPPPIKE